MNMVPNAKYRGSLVLLSLGFRVGALTVDRLWMRPRFLICEGAWDLFGCQHGSRHTGVHLATWVRLPDVANFWLFVST